MGPGHCEMSMREYLVIAKWDNEARVWVATSEDIPGLATEAETFERLVERVTAVAPELLTLNNMAPGAGDQLKFQAERREHFANAA